jgi:hypothetical protein
MSLVNFKLDNLVPQVAQFRVHGLDQFMHKRDMNVERVLTYSRLDLPQDETVPMFDYVWRRPEEDVQASITGA